MPAQTFARLLVLAGVGALAACTGTSSNHADSSVAGRPRPTLDGLAAEVAKIPPGAVAGLHLDGPAIDLAAPNAGFIQVEDLADLGHPVEVGLRLDADRFWLAPSWPEHIRYALVVRTIQLIPPGLGPDEDVDPGLYQGEVLVFDLVTGDGTCGGVRRRRGQHDLCPGALVQGGRVARHAHADHRRAAPRSRRPRPRRREEGARRMCLTMRSVIAGRGSPHVVDCPRRADLEARR